MEQTEVEKPDFRGIINDSRCTYGPVILIEDKSNCVIRLPGAERLTQIRMKKTQRPTCLSDTNKCLIRERKIAIQPTNQNIKKDAIKRGEMVSVTEFFSDNWKIELEGKGISIRGMPYASDHNNGLCEIRLDEKTDREHESEIIYISEEDIRVE